jgi:serine phosphatase RsbU (regulator of sigma subunit)
LHYRHKPIFAGTAPGSLRGSSVILHPAKVLVSMSIIIEKFETEFSKLQSPEEQVDAILAFSLNYLESKREYCLERAKAAMEISLKSNYRDGIVLSKFLNAFLLNEYHEYAKAESELRDAISGFDSLKSIRAKVIASNFLSYFLWYMGRFDEALSVIYKALEITADVEDPQPVGWVHYALGTFHHDLNDFSQSRTYFEKALAFFEKAKYPYGMGRSKNGLASLLIREGKYTEARAILEELLVLYRNLEMSAAEGRTLSDLGDIEFREGRFEDAYSLFREALDLRRRINHKQGKTTSLIQVAQCLFELGKTDEAEKIIAEGLEMARETNTRVKQAQCLHLLYRIHKSKGQPGEALTYMEKFYEIRSQVYGDQSANRIKQIQAAHASASARKDAEIERLKNVELKQAHDQIREKNKEILDSITYARRLQDVILHAETEIEKSFKEAFVLYQPKDIVAGDFYWFHRQNDFVYFALADCTGHGVPGALVSLICHNALNRALLEYKMESPGAILDKTREVVTGFFGKGNQHVRDGMDIGLFRYHPPSRELVISSANISFWIFNSPNNLPEKISGQKQPVAFFENPKPFSELRIKTGQGTRIYVSSDGYFDQFGGPAGKKLKSGNFSKILGGIQGQSLDRQREELRQKFLEWKGSLEQIDDVCVAGFTF